MEETLRRWLPLIVIQVYTLCLHVRIARRMKRRAITLGLVAASGWMVLVPPLAMELDGARVSSTVISWLMAGTLFWVLAATCAALALLLHGAGRPFEPGRRRFLARAVPLAAAAPAAAAAAGVVIAKRIDVVEQRLALPGLPKDLDGLRIAQLTDVHYGAFFGPRELERAVAMANEGRPHLTVLTGDLITRFGDDLEGCLRILAGLKADAGVLGCHGNHERYARCEVSAARDAARFGIRILRRANETLRFGQAKLNLAGFDYQALGTKYLEGAEALLVSDAVNVLLQHNPDVLPRAAEAGFALTLAGHTHGGQINLEVAGTAYNMAAIYTPYTRGLYHHNGSSLYVSSGLGTVAVPVRLGAPPEVTLLRLCAA